MAHSVPLLLDTDIGSDIDDAVALSYLLRQPRCELLGITTVTGDVARRAACAEVLCRHLGRNDIPIHCGIAEPLVVGPGQPHVPQYDAIRDYPHRLDHAANKAIDFMRSTIRQNPGRVTLLSIGPLTNIALLFALDPEIPGLLKQFVSMGGSFFQPMRTHVPAEWNIRCDPAASWLVLNKPHSLQLPHLCVGLDVTAACTLAADDVRARFVAKPLDMALKMAEVWFQKVARVTFHDPLAAALIFQPELATYQRGRIAVPIDPNEKIGGQTLFDANPDGPHEVATTVDSSAFFTHFFSMFDR